jgi:magnesium chelatase subunit I
LAGIQGLMEKLKALGLGANEPDAVRASAAEFVLEGLYAHRRISRSEERGFTAEERKREPREASPQMRGSAPKVMACNEQ